MEQSWELYNVFRNVYEAISEEGERFFEIRDDHGSVICQGLAEDSVVAEQLGILREEHIRQLEGCIKLRKKKASDKKIQLALQSKSSKSFKELESSFPEQLELFTQSNQKYSEYSHTIELYDFIPKYVWGKVERVEDKFLEPIKREFVCRGIKYNLILSTAFIQGSDGFKAYFPGKREELVEDALRKLMTEDNAIYLDDDASLKFSLYQLQKELSTHQHTYDYTQLKESLEILTKTSVEIESEDKNVKIIFSPIEILGLSGTNDETQTFVKFSSLITRSINEGTYQLVNYDKLMGYTSTIARQLHKRMAHHYVQASLTEKYEILLSTIIRDFGITKQKQLQQNLQKIEAAIEELIQKEVILNCKAEKIYKTGGKQKLEEVKFSIQPHPYFINETKKANATIRQIKESISKDYKLDT